MAYIGSKKSKKYHTIDCKWGQVIPDDYAVCFSDCKEAEEAGFSPCGQCHPDFCDIIKGIKRNIDKK